MKNLLSSIDKKIVFDKDGKPKYSVNPEINFLENGKLLIYYDIKEVK